MKDWQLLIDHSLRGLSLVEKEPYPMATYLTEAVFDRLYDALPRRQPAMLGVNAHFRTVVILALKTHT